MLLDEKVIFFSRLWKMAMNSSERDSLLQSSQLLTTAESLTIQVENKKL
jgi:hypothetical protein